MYASTTIAPIKPDKWDDLANVISDFLKDRVGGPEGLKTAYLLRESGTDKAMTVVFYDTESNARASAEPGGLFSEIVPKLASCFAGQPERSINEVIAAIE